MEEINTAAHHSHGLNWVDIVLLLMMVASGVFAMMRGFVKEGFVLVSLIGASFVSTKFYPVVQPWMRHQIESKVLADSVAWIGVFILTLIVFIPITSFFVDKVSGTAMSAVDRSLGFVFGALRGLLIGCLLYLLAAQFWDKPKDAPIWIKEARTRPLLETGAALVKDLVPLKKSRDGSEEDAADELSDDEFGGTDNLNDASTSRSEKIRKAEKMLQDLARPEPALNNNQPAYDQKARDRLNELIEKKSNP
jgi:membrane protein required for colicin V production